ncbi:hypothetical protein GCM10009869_06600 [Amnibacterium kyonggiense]
MRTFIDERLELGHSEASGLHPGIYLDGIAAGMDAALEQAVERFLFLGSPCIDPKSAPHPIKADTLLTGHLAETNDA